MTSPNNIHRLSTSVENCDHRRGNLTAQITLVEYGDYQCPYSREAHYILQEIQAALGKELLFVFRHFPQCDIHSKAGHAAEAAEAAGSQGRFWEMHDYLFDHQSQLTDSDLVEYAIALNLNINQFLQEMTADHHLERINADLESGRKSHVIQTPTFFINSIRYAGNLSFNALLSAIEKDR